MNLPGINVVVIAAILIGVGTLLAAAEAQTDTRHASLPPDAEQVLIWKSGYFNMGCNANIERNEIYLLFYHDVDHPHSRTYFWDSEGAGTQTGGIKVRGASTHDPSTYFQILDSGINGSDWYVYGIAFGRALCPDRPQIIDFKIGGNCDGSTITMQTSDYRTNMTQIIKPHPTSNYDVWCGYIPDAPIGTLGNKIF